MHIDGHLDDRSMEHSQETNEHAHKDEMKASAVATDDDFFSFSAKHNFRELLLEAEAVASGEEAREEEEEKGASFFPPSDASVRRPRALRRWQGAGTPGKAKQLHHRKIPGLAVLDQAQSLGS